MTSNNADDRNDDCLHCRHSNNNSREHCCEAAAFDELIIRFLPLLAANDFLE